MQLCKLVILLSSAALAFSDTLLVPGEYPSILAAIYASSDGDTVLVGPGTYKEQISFLGKNIVVRSALGPGATRIYSLWTNPTAVFFTNGEDSTAVLEGFTINNTGQDSLPGEDEPLPDYGGGIYIEDSSPTIRNNVIQYCVASVCGGGVYCFNSSPTLEGNTIEGCFAEHAGGGFYAYCDPGTTERIRLISNTVSDNEAYTCGGGIYVSDASFVEISGNVISGNDNCGIYISHTDSIFVLGNKISDNIGDDGGGAHIRFSSSLSLIGNMICDNQAFAGGGLAVFFTDTYIENTSFSGNVSLATSFGSAGVLAENCDFLQIMNCIIWDNISYGGISNIIRIYVTYLSVEYSDIEGGIDSIWVDSLSVINWGDGNIDIDPLFEVGPLSDYHLSEGSPCIDTGNPAPEYNDPEDPFNPGYALWPAMGYLRNDMGAYGGRGVDYILSAEEEEGPFTPGLLLRSYPNPFTSTCTVSFTVPEAGPVSLDVYDLSGRLVQTLFEGEHPSGSSSALFDGSDLPSGVYVIVFRTSDQMVSHRCVLVR